MRRTLAPGYDTLPWTIDSRESPRAPSPTTALLVGVAVALAGNVATNTIEPPDSWHWWPWAVWSVVAVLVVAAAGLERAGRRGTVADPDAVIADLLAPVENDWAREAVRREVTRPAPVGVRWSSTGRPAAGRPAVLGDPAAGDWREFPLTGRTDALNTGIVAAFRSLPRRQLVVLGEPGAGKSVFAILLTLGLLRTRVSGEPLPVLVPAGSWDPVDPLDDFVAARLAEDHRSRLARHGDPRAVARHLIERNRVLPILDGLDELPPGSIGRALRVLDDHTSAGRPLVVTCRIREYERAGHILTTAAVVELEPVTADAAMTYLAYPEPARARWAPVFAHLDGVGGGVGEALSTPLMVALARTAYRDPATDPAELLTLGTRAEVTGRLMDAFVTAVYPGERERRWLRFLAHHLYSCGTRDLRPEQFDPGLGAADPNRWRLVPPIVTVLTGAVAGGALGAAADLAWWWAIVAGGLVAAGGLLPIERITPWWYGLLGGALTGLVTGYWPETLLGGLVCGALARIAGDRATPAARGLAARPAVRELVGGPVVRGLAAGTVFAGTAALLGRDVVLHAVMATILFGGTALMASGGWTAVRTRLTLVILAARGLLPWRYRRFLNDAYRRGVLRRAGAVPQFRHALLQDHLAEPARKIRTNIAREGIAPPTRGVPREEAPDKEVPEKGVPEQDATWLLNHARTREFFEAGDVDGLRSYADAGFAPAIVMLAGLLADRGDENELRRRAEGGDVFARLGLARVLAGRGAVDEAIALLRQPAGARAGAAARHLAELLVARGDVDEAIAVLRHRADGGDPIAADMLRDLRES